MILSTDWCLKYINGDKGFIIPIISSTLHFWKEPQNQVQLCYSRYAVFSVFITTGQITNEPVSTLYCYAFCKFSLLSKQYLICCNAMPLVGALFTTAWRADWILFDFFYIFFFLLGSCVSQSLIIFFSRMNSLKLVCVSLSVLPQTGLKLTEDLWVLSWEISSYILHVIVLLIIPVWCFPLCNT